MNANLSRGTGTFVGGGNIYETPVDKTVTLKQVAINNTSRETGIGVSLILNAGDGTAGIYLGKYNLNPDETVHWNGWIVLRESDVVVLLANTENSIMYWTSGEIN